MLKKWTNISVALLGGAITQSASAQITINELDSSTLQSTSNTEAYQFVELKGAGGSSLDGYTLVFINGASNRVYRTVSLDGWKINGNGLFVVGNPGVPKVDLVLPLVTVAPASAGQTSENNDTIQPGPDAVVLVRNPGGALFNPNWFLEDSKPDVLIRSGRSAIPNTAGNFFEQGVAPVSALVYQSSAAMPLESDLLTAFSTVLASSTQVREGERASGDNFVNRLSDSVARVGGSWVSAEPTPGEENKIAGGPAPVWPAVTYTPPASPEFAITEINGHISTQNSNGQGGPDDKDQFIEIVNISTVPKDLSGFTLRTNAGTAHVFSKGTWLQPGQAIVVFKGGVDAADVGITSKFGSAIVVNSTPDTPGETKWSLADKGVDTVRLVDKAGADKAGALFFALEGGSMADTNPGNDTPTGGLTLDQRFGHQWKRATTGPGFSIDSPLADQAPAATLLDQLGPAGAAHFQEGHPLSSPGEKADAGTDWKTVTDVLTLTTSAAVSDLKGRNAGEITVAFPAASSEERTVLLAMDRQANTAAGSGDDLSIEEIAEKVTQVNSSVYSLTPEPNRKYYEVKVPSNQASITLKLETDPTASSVDEVYTFSATSSWAVNTLNSTPPTVRVVEGISQVTFSKDVVLEGAGAGDNGTRLTLTLPAGKTAPAEITFDIYTGDMDAATDKNAVFDPTVPVLQDPATSSDSGSRDASFGVVRIPAKGAAPVGTLKIEKDKNSGTVQLNVPEDAAFHDNRFVRFTVIGRQSAADPSQELSFGGIGHLKIVQPLVINEIQGAAGEPGSFIEIVNNSGDWVDLEGKTLSIGGTVVHTFPWGSQLPVGGAAVVFAGGLDENEEGNTALYGTSLVQNASSGGLANLTTGAEVSLRQGDTVLNSRTFAGFTGGSDVRGDVREKDGTGLFAAVGHNTVYTPAIPSSPGLKGTGVPFVDIKAQLAVEPDRASIPELWALSFVPNRGQLVIRRSDPDANSEAGKRDLKVRLFHTPELPAAEPVAGAQLILPGAPASTTASGANSDRILNLTIPAGQTEVVFPVLPADTQAGNGDRSDEFRLIGGGYLNSTLAPLLVRDSGSLNATFRGDGATARKLVESAGADAAAIQIVGGHAGSGITLISDTATPALFAPSAALILNAAGAGTVGVDLPPAANTAAVDPDRVQQVVLFSDAAGDSANTLLTVTTVDDGGVVEAGPYINEIDYTGKGLHFVEVVTPGVNVPLEGFTLAVYDSAGKLVSATPLTGSTTPFLAVGPDYSLGITSAKQTVPEFTLPESGAVALYRKPSPEFKTGDPVVMDLLLDAVVYGSTPAAALREALNPAAPAPVTETTAAGSASRVPDAALSTVLRAAAGFAEAQRTPGASNSSGGAPDKTKILDNWLARFGLTGTSADLNADPDGDGTPNGVEFFTGTSPVAPDAVNSWFSIPPQDGKFIPAATAEAAEQTSLKRQGSADLTLWEDIPVEGKAADPAPSRYFLRILQMP